MGHEDWTVDRLHVALPHSASRRQLLQDVNLTPLEQLPAVLDRWADAAESLEAARDRIAAVRIAVSVAGRLPDYLDVFDTHKQLPEPARRDLAFVLVDAQEDPLAASEPYGQDDGIIRIVAQGHVTAVVLVGRETSTLTVLAIAYAGPA